jgi:menaquinone-dependent protoporphyrinogen oxidase
MTILVAVSSKHGSTREIAEAITKVLRTEGFTVALREPTEVLSLEHYQAAIIGSALYFGQWRPDAVGFVRRFTEPLSTIPVWAFSSGQVGHHAVDQPANIHHHMTLAHAKEHRLFGGRIDDEKLDMVEKILVKNVNVAERDERDWTEIRAWAKSIAASLQETQLVSG